MKPPRLFLPPCLAALLAVTPLAGIAAELASETRPVAGFHRVVLRASGELLVRQGPDESLRVEAEPRLLPLIGSEVRDGTLYLEFRAPQINTLQPVRFHLGVKRLEALSSEASADIHAGPLAGKRFALELAGSGNVDIAALETDEARTRITGSSDVAIGGGRIGAQTVEIEGAGSYAAGSAPSRSAQVKIGGSGNVEVSAREQLGVEISGSGEVRYRGNPQVQERISGAGSVQRAD